jgi:hypothetical protein
VNLLSLIASLSQSWALDAPRDSCVESISVILHSLKCIELKPTALDG